MLCTGKRCQKAVMGTCGNVAGGLPRSQSCIVKLQTNQVGWDFGQPGLLEEVPVHSRQVETR